jgi:hypothetical protein
MFWEDVWLGSIPLREKVSRFYNLTFSIKVTMVPVFEEGWGCIRFRRVLWGETSKIWQELKNLCANVSLSKDRDRCVWLLEKSGIFLVKSMYVAMKTKKIVFSFKNFWGVRVPLRVKVFIWLVFKNNVLT